MKKNESFLRYKFNDWVRDFTSLGNPIILLFIPFIVLGYSRLYGFLLLALLINECIGSAIKLLFHRTRPDQQEFSGALEKIDAGSFPSLHAARITLVYLTLGFFNPSLPIQIALFMVIPIVGISRVLLKRHFISDVIGGFFLGASIFTIFYFYLY